MLFRTKTHLYPDIKMRTHFQHIVLFQVLTPNDDVGTLHSLSLGPDGHLAVTEFCVGGEHCVKIFRFYECRCHGGVIPARKRRSITASPDT